MNNNVKPPKGKKPDFKPILIRKVPASVHKRLKLMAIREDRSVQDICLDYILKGIARKAS